MYNIRVYMFTGIYTSIICTRPVFKCLYIQWRRKRGTGGGAKPPMTKLGWPEYVLPPHIKVVGRLAPPQLRIASYASDIYRGKMETESKQQVYTCDRARTHTCRQQGRCTCYMIARRRTMVRKLLVPPYMYVDIPLSISR